MTAQSPSRQIPTRRPPWPAAQRGGSLRGRARRRRRLDWRGWLAIAGATTLLALFAWAFLSRRFAPASNTDRTRFDAVIILGTPAEMHTAFQLELRGRFPHNSVAVLNIVNGYASYLPPREDYAVGAYPVRVALYREGSTEAVLEAADRAMRELLAESAETP